MHRRTVGWDYYPTENKKEIMNNLLHYSPIIIAVMIFLIQQRIVVTPEQLKKNTVRFSKMQKSVLPHLARSRT
jgi:hypothetical protein